MRPLHVLMLALAVVAAVILGLVLNSGDSSGRGPAKPTVPGAAPARPVDVADLQSPGRVAEKPERLVSEPERAPVATSAEDRVPTPGRIFGLVVNVEDEPIPDARVQLLNVKSSLVSEALHFAGNEELPDPVAELVSDAEGRFEFASVRPGTWTLLVTHDTHNRYEANGIVVGDAGVVEERIVLEYGLSISGYVHDALSGAPIQGATLVLDNPLAALLPAARRKQTAENNQATTDALGFFGFKNAGGGQKTLIVRAKGYATQVHGNFGLSWGFQSPDDQKGPQVFRRNMANQRRLEAKKPKEISFELLRGKTIGGRVVGQDSAGISGVEVIALQQTDGVGSRGSALSASNGEFLVEDLAEGVYTLQAIAQGYSAQVVQAVETDRTDVEIVLAEHGSITGRVIVAATNKPVSNFVVKVRALHPDNPSWGNVVARGEFRDRSKGKFSISGVPTGDYVIEGISRGFASSFSAPFAVVDGRETPDVLVPLTQGGTVRGLVVDGNGNPLSGAQVSTRDNNHVDDEFFEMITGLNPSASTKVSVRTDENGTFELQLMTPDTYQIQVSKKGFSTTTINEVVIGDGSVVDAGTLQLQKGAVVKGRVFGPGNSPAAGATVSLVPADNNPWGAKEARTDANGNYVLDNAVAGTYKLSASRSEGERGNPFAAILDIRNSEIEISLSDGEIHEQDIHMASVRRAQ